MTGGENVGVAVGREVAVGRGVADCFGVSVGVADGCSTVGVSVGVAGIVVGYCISPLLSKASIDWSVIQLK